MTTNYHLEELGFRYFMSSGAHTARTMMLDELRILLFSRPTTATQEDYRLDVEEFNLLQKPTENSRRYTFKPLCSLYGLSNKIPIFKVLRDFWELDECSQPLLALQSATARDPYLYKSVKYIQSLQPGALFIKEELEAALAQEYPDKFSSSSLQSLVRNISSSWTQSGFLEGKAKKYRTQPKVSYVNLAYSLFLAYCHELSGQRMFDSFWCRLLEQEREHLFELAHRASLRGLISFKQISEIIEVSFPNIDLPSGTFSNQDEAEV